MWETTFAKDFTTVSITPEYVGSYIYLQNPAWVFIANVVSHMGLPPRAYIQCDRNHWMQSRGGGVCISTSEKSAALSRLGCWKNEHTMRRVFSTKCATVEWKAADRHVR